LDFVECSGNFAYEFVIVMGFHECVYTRVFWMPLCPRRRITWSMSLVL